MNQITTRYITENGACYEQYVITDPEAKTALTITPERAQVIDFSTPYFVTGQQFLVPVKGADKLDAYSHSRIGAVKGTTGEQALHQRFPAARVLSYDDIPLALTALRSGNVQAITQDSTILAGLLGEAPDKAKFKILPALLSKEEIGVGVKKGERKLPFPLSVTSQKTSVKAVVSSSSSSVVATPDRKSVV